MRFACTNCDQDWNGDDFWYDLEYQNRHVALCSPACIMEHTWKLRETQPKLSKSKETPSAR